MSDLAATVGFLVDGDRSPEQHAALEWCAEAGIDADTVSLAAVATDGTVPTEYDVLWWHRAEPAADVPALTGASEPIRTYVEKEGGLLLTLRALEAVPTLDIDPVVPDVSLLEEPTTAGLFWKSHYDDHPAVDGLDGVRIRTRAPEGVQPSARYERVLPERGTVLASTLHEDIEAPHEVALVGWRVGEGDVAGLGTALEFDGPVIDAAAKNRTRLLSNLLAILGDGERRLLDHGVYYAPQSLRDDDNDR
ncbi:MULTISPECIES: hypothetical protein [Natrialbaceae]|uniref:hypothetical protein n=1 Tax=Natrialbaceae TaxID=1644061 RepID=UPI00207CF761|nr:hypothetical protein [Natronococcus sp. CG52]